jgi:DNA-binding response OmpR family regulator
MAQSAKDLRVEAFGAGEPGRDLSSFGIDRSLLVIGHVVLAPAERQVFIHGRRVHFSVREFDLLHAFVVCAGHVLSRGRVYEHVWRRAMLDPHDRAVDVYVGRVRAKLAQASPGWVYIHTHFGHGYRFEPEPARR